MKLKTEMTPAALARATGYTTQTINKWIRQFNWQTLPIHGVKGGRARVIVVDERVQQFLQDTRRGGAQVAHIVAEPEAEYLTATSPLEHLLIGALQQMNDIEREQLSALLMREGINGVLVRLGIKA
ncbi:putative DNA-binding transcriptional regulator [Shimwellia pseudoproteus]|uniref:YfeC-like transcriptional regulator n=1 Tax=Shimwellia pseudoproteus TaxID=570012 RepID=UPI0018EE02DD|nr:YfeC-like transcriptional regulator [Shimwellia pseudoproteus]MBJ3815150.1 putative DNA-binding transcriptional regulator [Shimwellia pseudoproteus]